MKAVNAYYRKHKTLDGCPDRLSCIKPLSGKSPVEIQKEARTAAKTEKKPSIRAQLAQDKKTVNAAPKKQAAKTKNKGLEV